MTKGSRVLLAGLCAAILVVGALGIACRLDSRVQPPTPPLLRDATGHGGWWSGGCPRRTEFGERDADEARSPEIEDRLRKQFPAGSSASELKRALSSQGFTDPNKCETDSSITRMIFRQRGGGLFGPYPAFAVVAW